MSRALSHPLPREDAAVARRPPASEAAYVGRKRELAILRNAFAASLDGRAVAVVVEGAAGVGKSALVRAFLARLEPTTRPLVLAARCHPHGAVPFAAAAGLVDGLGTVLTRDGPAARALAAADGAALAQALPALGRALGLVAAVDGGATPPVLRARAFQALRVVLGAVAARRPVVLWIDDAEWLDADSAALLRALGRAPDPPAVLLVLSGSGAAGRLGTVAAWPRARAIALPPLSTAEGTALARALLGTGDDDPAAEALDVAAGGNPLLLCELARDPSLPSDDWNPRTPGDLDDLIAEQLDRLPPAARHLLELLAVAGHPLEEPALLRAAHLEHANAALGHLCGRGLVRIAWCGGEPIIEITHDGVRRALETCLGAEARSERHHALARALDELPGVAPMRLATHSLGADDGRAGERAYASAEAARRALAFHQAAALYQRAIEHGTAACPLWQLHARRGDALAHAGATREAARSLATAAWMLAGASSGPSAEVLDLERAAAEHYLRSGGLADALALLGQTLTATGRGLPRSRARALAARAAGRVGLRRARRRRAPAVLQPLDPARLDALWSAARGLRLHDGLAATVLETEHAVLAARTKDAVHGARALAAHAMRAALAGGDVNRRRSAALLATAEGAAAGDATVEPFRLLVTAVAAETAHRWRDALGWARRAETLARESGAWEIVDAQAVAVGALAALGELGQLGVLVPELLREAAERDDQHAGILLRLGPAVLTWLALDDPEEARRQVETALAVCPGGRHSVQHHLGAQAQVEVDLYAGEAHAAVERLRRAWPALRACGALGRESVRLTLRDLRARAAVAAARGVATRGRARLLRRAARDAWRVADVPLPAATPMAEALRAGIAAVRDQRAAAAEHLEGAALGFERAEMSLHAAACRHRLGALTGGVDGAVLMAAAESWMAAHGVRNPARMAAMLVPGVVG